MNKKILVAFFFTTLTIFATVGQRSTGITPSTFKTLLGCWQGTLHYSGTMIRKPYTTTAELVVSQIGKSHKFTFLHNYTKDTNDYKADTISISNNGRKLNDQRIKSKQYTNTGTLKVVTEVAGFDDDNNKAVIVRGIYTIGKQLYTYKRQVKPEGQTEWLERQEFVYKRKPCRK
jgi:hypothetical protein